MTDYLIKRETKRQSLLSSNPKRGSEVNLNSREICELYSEMYKFFFRHSSEHNVTFSCRNESQFY